MKEIGGAVIANGIDNMQNGKGFFKGALKSIDWADVAISSAEGALIGSGAGLITVGVSTAVSSGLRASVDYTEDGGFKDVFGGILGGKTKTLGEFTRDGINEVIGFGFDKSMGKIGYGLFSDMRTDKASKLLGYFGESVIGGASGSIAKGVFKNESGQEFIDWVNGYEKEVILPEYTITVKPIEKDKKYTMPLEIQKDLLNHIEENGTKQIK